MASQLGIAILPQPGGHFSGGGVGNLVRKYGLSADSILDAIMVDSHGRVLNRKSMGEEGMIWAIRGGGGGSFGVIVSWTIKLVNVSHVITVFNIEKSLEEEAIMLVHKWQYIADKLPDESLGIKSQKKGPSHFQSILPWGCC